MTAVILAGGQSRRMGRDKLLLPLSGERLLDRAVRRYGEVFPRVLVSVSGPERYPELGEMRVFDVFPGAGPLAGLHAGLLAAEDDVFLTGGDMPFSSPEKALELINSAMETDPGLDYDTYPYNAFSCSIGSTVFDEGCLENWGRDYSDILLTGEPYRYVRCTEEIFRDARENHPAMLAVAFSMREEEIRLAVKNRRGIIASDGLLRGGSGHPRAAGTFPRVLGRYVREAGELSLMEALRKMTLAPADRLRLFQKGRIRLDCDADITVFDPKTIIDRADFGDLEPPEGIEYVLIGGEVAMEKGRAVNRRLGRFIPFR